MAGPRDQDFNTRIAAVIGSFQSGDLDGAMRDARAMVSEFPSSAVLPNVIGAILMRQGRLDDAIASFEASIRIDPHYAQAYSNLGGAYGAANRPDAALASYEKALALDPTLAEAHYNSALLLNAQGKNDAATTAFREALRIDPAMHDAHHYLGRILLRAGDRAQALEHFESALRLQPENADTLNIVGSILVEENQAAKARGYFEKAVALDPDNPEMLYNLGVIERFDYRADTALELFERAARLAAGQGNKALEVSSRVNAAGTRANTGQRAAAIEEYRRVLRLDRDNIDAHHNLGMILDYDDSETHLGELEALAGDPQHPAHSSDLIHFALGKALSQTRQYDRAFAAIKRANNLHRRAHPHDTKTTAQLFAAIPKAFQALAPADPFPQSTPRPIFILGMPRSGTSLIEQICASHSRVFGAGELTTATDALKPALRSVPRMAWATAGLGQEMVLDHAPIDAFRTAYLQKLNDLSAKTTPRASFVTDKMPLNFRWIGFLHRAFPNAVFLHVKRDPIATCWSNYQRRFVGRELAFAYDLDDLVAYYRLYEGLMAYWHAAIPGAILDISYDALTEAPRAEIARILAFCDLEWQDACLAFHETERDVNTASNLQVRKPLYRGSSQQWLAFARHLAPLTEAFGAP